MDFRKKAALGTWGYGIIEMFLTSLGFMGATMVSMALCEEHGYTSAQFSLVFSLIVLGNILCYSVIAQIIAKIGPKKTVIIGSFGPVFGYLVLAYVSNIYIVWGAAVIFGFLLAMGGSVTYTIFVSNWYMTGRGKMLSIRPVLLGVGQIIGPLLIALLVSKMPTKSVCVTLGIVYSCASLLCSLFLSCDLPSAYNAEPIGLGEAQEENASEKPVTCVYEPDVPTRKLLALPETIIVLLIPVICTMASTMFGTYQIYIYQGYGVDYTQASLLVTVSAVVSILLNMLLGTLADKFSPNKLMVLFALLAGGSRFLTFLFNGRTAAIVMALTVGTYCFANMYPGLVVPSLYGLRHSSLLLGWGGTLAGFGGMAAAPVAMALMNADGGSYNLLIITIGCMYIICALLHLYVMNKNVEKHIRKLEADYKASLK